MTWAGISWIFLLPQAPNSRGKDEIWDHDTEPLRNEYSDMKNVHCFMFTTTRKHTNSFQNLPNEVTGIQKASRSCPRPYFLRRRTRTQAHACYAPEGHVLAATLTGHQEDQAWFAKSKLTESLESPKRQKPCKNNTHNHSLNYCCLTRPRNG